MSLQEFHSSFSFSRQPQPDGSPAGYQTLQQSLLQESLLQSLTAAQESANDPAQQESSQDEEDEHLPMYRLSYHNSSDSTNAQIAPDTSITKLSVSSSFRGPGPTIATPPRKPMSRITLVLVFFICGLCWGCTFLFINKCLPKLDPMTIAQTRCTLAFLLLFSIQLSIMYLPCIGTPESRIKQRHEFWVTYTSPISIFHMAVLGFFFSALAGALISVAQTHVSGGITGIILMIEPLGAPFLSKLCLPRSIQTEPITRWTVAGLFFGLIGTGVSSLPTLNGADSGETLSLLACIGASLTFCVGTLIGQYFDDRRPVLHRIIGQMFFAAIFLLPLTFILRSQGVFSDFPGGNTELYTPFAEADLTTWAWICALSWGPTVGAWGLFYLLLRELGSLSTSVNFLIPPVSMFLGAAFNSEWDHLSTSDKLLEVGGMLIVLLGVGFVLYATHQYELELSQAKQKSQGLGGIKPIQTIDETRITGTPSDSSSTNDYQYHVTEDTTLNSSSSYYTLNAPLMDRR